LILPPFLANASIGRGHKGSHSGFRTPWGRKSEAFTTAWQPGIDTPMHTQSTFFLSRDSLDRRQTPPPPLSPKGRGGKFLKCPFYHNFVFLGPLPPSSRPWMGGCWPDSLPSPPGGGPSKKKPDSGGRCLAAAHGECREGDGQCYGPNSTGVCTSCAPTHYGQYCGRAAQGSAWGETPSCLAIRVATDTNDVKGPIWCLVPDCSNTRFFNDIEKILPCPLLVICCRDFVPLCATSIANVRPYRNQIEGIF